MDLDKLTEELWDSLETPYNDTAFEEESVTDKKKIREMLQKVWDAGIAQRGGGK